MGCGPVRILSAVSCLSRGRSVAKKKEKWGPSIGEKFRFRESPVRFSKRIRLDDERVERLFVYSISFCLCLNDRSHSIRYRLIVELGEWGLSQSNLRTLRCFRAAKREKKTFFSSSREWQTEPVLPWPHLVGLFGGIILGFYVIALRF